MHPHAEPDHGQPYAMQRTTLHWLRVPKFVCGPKKDLESLLTKHRSTVAIYKEMYSHAEPDHGQPYVMQRTTLHWLRVPIKESNVLILPYKQSGVHLWK